MASLVDDRSKIGRWIEMKFRLGGKCHASAAILSASTNSLTVRAVFDDCNVSILSDVFDGFPRELRLELIENLRPHLDGVFDATAQLRAIVFYHSNLEWSVIFIEGCQGLLVTFYNFKVNIRFMTLGPALNEENADCNNLQDFRFHLNAPSNGGSCRAPAKQCPCQTA